MKIIKHKKILVQERCGLNWCQNYFGITDGQTDTHNSNTVLALAQAENLGQAGLANCGQAS